MAYFGDDEILYVKDKGYKCLNDRKVSALLQGFSPFDKGVLTRQCNGLVSGGTEEYFNCNYKIVE